MKRISEMSELAGVSRRTLQYYDDIGILGTERSEVNYRLYSDDDMQRLWEIMVYKELGVQLRAIQKLIELSEKDRKEYLLKYIAGLKQEICSLQDQIEFSVWILNHGMPKRPRENDEKSYAEEILKLRELIKES